MAKIILSSSFLVSETDMKLAKIETSFLEFQCNCLQNSPFYYNCSNLSYPSYLLPC